MVELINNITNLDTDSFINVSKTLYNKLIDFILAT